MVCPPSVKVSMFWLLWSGHISGRWSAEDIVQKQLRGIVGWSLRLTIRRFGQDDQIESKVVREGMKALLFNIYVRVRVHCFNPTMGSTPSVAVPNSYE